MSLKVEEDKNSLNSINYGYRGHVFKLWFICLTIHLLQHYKCSWFPDNEPAKYYCLCIPEKNSKRSASYLQCFYYNKILIHFIYTLNKCHIMLRMFYPFWYSLEVLDYSCYHPQMGIYGNHYVIEIYSKVMFSLKIHMKADCKISMFKFIIKKDYWEAELKSLTMATPNIRQWLFPFWKREVLVYSTPLRAPN